MWIWCGVFCLGDFCGLMLRVGLGLVWWFGAVGFARCVVWFWWWGLCFLVLDVGWLCFVVGGGFSGLVSLAGLCFWWDWWLCWFDGCSFGFWTGL